MWAFERALETARIDGQLLDHLLVACVCLIARAERCSPRTVLETYFRQAVPDDVWRESVLPLLG